MRWQEKILKRLLRILEESKVPMSKKETQARLHITWQLSNDGLRPTEAPWGYVVRNPVTKVVPPGSKIMIDLCVAANYPMLAFPVRSHADDLVVSQIIQAGQDITVTVENKSKHQPLVIEDKEGLVNLFPLLHEGSTTEVG